jgi:hypothetical protein
MVRGKRPDIPEKVLPFTRQLIEQCWAETPEKRPSFSEIWRSLQYVNFKILPGVESAAVEGFVLRIERLQQ